MKKLLTLLLVPLSLTGVAYAATNALGIDNNTANTWKDVDTDTCANVTMPTTLAPNSAFTKNPITFASGYKDNTICTAEYQDSDNNWVRISVYKDSNGLFHSSSSNSQFGVATAYGAILVLPAKSARHAKFHALAPAK